MHDLQQSVGAKAALTIFQSNDLIRCTIKSIDQAKETCDIWFILPETHSMATKLV